MKRTHLLHAVSVIVAVAIGGAVTGTTEASWSDTATLNAGTVRSGSLVLTASADATEVSLGPNGSATITVALDRSGEGRNLRARTSLTSVTGDGVAVAIALADKPQGCPQGNAHGRYTSWHGQPIDLFDETPADFASSRVACLRLSTAKNGDVAASVELTFTTQQVRDGLPAGWRARSSVRVTLAAKGQAQTMAAVSDTQPATPGVAAAGTTQAPRPVEAPAPPSGTPVPASDSTPAAPTPTADSVGESTAPDARPATEDTTNDPEVEEEVLSE